MNEQAERHRILFLHVGMDMVRGSERVLIDIVEGLDPSKFAVEIICNSRVLLDAIPQGVRSHLFPIAQPITPDGRFGEPRRLWAQLRFVIERIREFRPHVVHCNNIEHLQWLIAATRLMRVPVIGHMHQLYNSWLRCVYLLYQADFVVGCSHALVNGVIADGFPAGATRVVYNGITANGLESVSALSVRGERIPSDAVVLAAVGAVYPFKGFDIAVDAVHRLQKKGIDAHLLIMGEGDAEEALQAQAARLGVADKIHLLGSVPRADVLAIIRNDVDITLVPSRYESLSLVSIESQSMGVPVVVSDVGGVPETVIPGETGFVFPSGDPGALADAVERLLELKASGIDIENKCRAWVADRFSMPNMIAAFTNIYDLLISEQGSRRLPGKPRFLTARLFFRELLDPEDARITNALQRLLRRG